MIPFLLFLIALLSLSLGASIAALIRVTSEVKYQTERKNYWYEQAGEYRALWLAALIASDDDEPDDNDGLGLNVPEDDEENPDLPPLAMGMAAGKIN